MATGTIGAALTDSLVLNSDCVNDTAGAIAHARDEWFVCVYREFSTTNTILVSFSVDNNGAIPATVQDTITVDTNGVGARPEPTVTKVTTGVVVVGYAGACGDVELETFTIDTSGNFGACDPVDIQELSTDNSNIVHIEKTKHADVFAATWNSGGKFHITTVTIDTSGNISTVVEDFVINDTGLGDAGPFQPFGTPSLVWTGQGDFHAVADEGNGSDGYVVTFTIDSCGNIGCIQDRHEFDTTQGEHVALNSNDDGTLILIYRATAGNGGECRTIAVDACGNMTNSDVITAMGFSSGNLREASLTRLDLFKDKNLFLGVANTNFESYSFTSSGTITKIDTLSSIAEAGLITDLVAYPENACYVVGCGLKVSTKEFFVWSLAVVSESNGKLPADKTDILTIVTADGGLLRGDITHVIDNFYAVIYPTDDFATIKLSTIEIEPDGNIAAALTNTITLQTSKTSMGSVTKIAEGTIAVTIRFADGDTPTGATIDTYTVNSSGTISTRVDTQSIESAAAETHVDLVKTEHADLFIATWQIRSNNNIRFATITIDTVGNISAPTETVTITTSTALLQWVEMVWTGVSNFYAIAYTGPASDGFVATFDIDACGNIGCVQDTLEFDTTDAARIHLQSDEAGTLVISSRDGSFNIILNTVSVDACGNLTNQDEENLGEFDGFNTNLLWLDEVGDFFLFLYDGRLESWSTDACHNLTKEDSMALLTDVEVHGRMTRRECTKLIVAVGIVSTDNKGACDSTNFSIVTILLDNTITVSTAQSFSSGNAIKLMVLGFI